MNLDWLQDGRKIPDDVMRYIRIMAVNAVRELGQSPEVVIKVFNFNRACMYRWLRLYDEGGYEALESEMPPGAERIISDDMDDWLKQTVLNQTPLDFDYDTPLWTCKILMALLEKEFQVRVSESTMRFHLKNLGLTAQKPAYQDVDRDEQEVEHFFNDKFPRIQRLAARLKADVGFQGEAGVGVMARYGKTWGLSGHTPAIKASVNRGGFNVLSMITTGGELRYSIKEGPINGDRFIDFLAQVIRGREQPLILLVGHASFHASKAVRDFARAHRTQIRLYFLPKRCPEFNPDEQVWNEVKANHVGKQPVRNKQDLKKRLKSALAGLQKNTQRILSFFGLDDTKYARHPMPCES